MLRKLVFDPQKSLYCIEVSTQSKKVDFFLYTSNYLVVAFCHIAPLLKRLSDEKRVSTKKNHMAVAGDWGLGRESGTDKLR